MLYSDWLYTHRKHFIQDDYSLPEIIALSVAVGFSRREMAQSLRNWPRGLWVKDVEASANRISQQVADHFEETLKCKDQLSLKTQWSELFDYLMYGKDWD